VGARRRPTVICLENVAEFLGWGPLDSRASPIKARMGETFAQWRGALELLGYKVDHRVLDASLYGAPTRRRRLFLVARCDGLPIVLAGADARAGAAAAHRGGVHRLEPSVPEHLRAQEAARREDAVAHRPGHSAVRAGEPDPFIVEVNHGKRDPRVAPLDQPLNTVTASRRSQAVIVPVIAGVGGRAGQSEATGGDQPVGTITAKNDRVLVTPSLIQVGYGEAPGQAARTLEIKEPLGTVTAQGRKHALVCPTLVQTGYGERPAIGDAPAQRPRYLDLHQPIGTLVADQKHAMVSAFLVKHFGDPQRTDGGGVVLGQELDQPQPTITTRDHSSLAAVCLAKFRGTDPSQPGSGSVEEPVPTISAGGIHTAEVRAFLTAYYGDDHAQGMGQDVREPARTLTTKARLGLVTVSGTDYQIVDIGMRMLEPHELLAAQFGRFAAGYDLSAAKTKPRRCG
jgi:DNA (cytosine-5)-methyltransferase 1